MFVSFIFFFNIKCCMMSIKNPANVFLAKPEVLPVLNGNLTFAFDITKDHFDTHIGYLYWLTSCTSGFPFFETICSWAPSHDRIDFIILPFDSFLDAFQSVFLISLCLRSAIINCNYFRLPENSIIITNRFLQKFVFIVQFQIILWNFQVFTCFINDLLLSSQRRKYKISIYKE